MKIHYKVENLRSINTMDFVEIKPITVLLGKNNSGKSSLLRVFPLLRQSVQDTENLALSWSGKYVDFGDFDSSLSNNSASEEITLSFKIDELALHSTIQTINNSENSIKKIFNEVEYSITYGNHYNGVINNVSMKLNDCNVNVDIDFTNDGCYIENFKIDNVDINSIVDNKLFQNVNLQLSEYNVFPRFSLNYSAQDFSENVGAFASEFFKDFYGFLKTEMDINKENIKEFDEHILSETTNMFKYEMLTEDKIKTLIELSNSGIFKNFYRNLLTQDYEDVVNSISLYCSTYWVLISVNNIGSILSKISQGNIYIGPSRIDGERVYSEKKFDTSRISHNGENLPMVLVDLFDKGVFDQYSKWIEEILEINVRVIKNGKDVVISIEKDGTEINIKDSGYGISQTLPILTQLWMISHFNNERNGKQSSEHLFDSKEIPKIVAIEQPEAHLHPSFNDKFIDALVSTIKTCVTGSVPLFVVETHSKGIIDRLGELIVRNEIPREDVNIVLFENGTEQQGSNFSRVRRSFFNNKGMLENWPLGFMGF